MAATSTTTSPFTNSQGISMFVVVLNNVILFSSNSIREASEALLNSSICGGTLMRRDEALKLGARP